MKDTPSCYALKFPWTTLQKKREKHPVSNESLLTFATTIPLRFSNEGKERVIFKELLSCFLSPSLCLATYPHGLFSSVAPFLHSTIMQPVTHLSINFFGPQVFHHPDKIVIFCLCLKKNSLFLFSIFLSLFSFFLSFSLSLISYSFLE